jgi:hypothetical protein
LVTVSSSHSIEEVMPKGFPAREIKLFEVKGQEQSPPEKVYRQGAPLLMRELLVMDKGGVVWLEGKGACWVEREGDSFNWRLNQVVAPDFRPSYPLETGTGKGILFVARSDHHLSAGCSDRFGEMRLSKAVLA